MANPVKVLAQPPCGIGKASRLWFPQLFCKLTRTGRNYPACMCEQCTVINPVVTSRLVLASCCHKLYPMASPHRISTTRLQSSTLRRYRRWTPKKSVVPGFNRLRRHNAFFLSCLLRPHKALAKVISINSPSNGLNAGDGIRTRSLFSSLTLSRGLYYKAFTSQANPMRFTRPAFNRF